ncbi:MAG: hypothetical protein R3B70_08305 [Polyangiaceae bacterium]
MRTTLFACTIAAALAIGCGNTVVEQTGGAGGSNTGGGGEAGGTTASTASTTSDTIPDECAVATAQPAPYSVTLRFLNPADNPVGGPVYLRQDCELHYNIRACSDGYADAIPLSGACTVDCGEQNTCIDCGACPEEAIEIPLGTSLDVSWNGVYYSFAQNNVGCSCHEEHIALPQHYRVHVPVFVTEDGIFQGSEDFQAIQQFDLPSAGVVEVPLYPPPE